MDFFRVLLLVVEALCSLLLIGLILLQKTKSEGMGMAFGGSAGEALLGARAGNVLTKMTVILGAVFLATTMGLAITYSGKQGQSLVEQSARAIPEAAQAVQDAPIVAPEVAPAVAPVEAE